MRHFLPDLKRSEYPCREVDELDDYETAFVNAVTVDVEIYAKNFFDGDEMKTAV